MNILPVTLNEKGYSCEILSIKHLPELRETIEGLHRDGHLDDEFYGQRLRHFEFHPPADFPGARSIIVVAAPQPKIRVTFVRNGEEQHVFIPPTYLTPIDKQITNLLTELLTPQGWHLARAVLPLKQLVVHSGLGTYGKNNICYLPGRGSFHRLLAFFTDVPCTEDPWMDNQMLERCRACSACVNSCPGGAISSDRFLLHAERCITLHNESPKDFPIWLDPSWHNCLVGCLICQDVCPENKRFLKRVEDIGRLSEIETDLIMRHTPFNELPASTIDQFLELDLTDCYDLIPRNLGVLLDKHVGKSNEGD